VQRQADGRVVMHAHSFTLSGMSVQRVQRYTSSLLYHYRWCAGMIRQANNGQELGHGDRRRGQGGPGRIR